MAKKKNYPPGTKEDVENIVGLFLMTFGQGVNPLHVNRSTVRAIRDQLVPPITRAVKANDWNEVWKREAATVLGWMAAVGRMAAQIAMEPKDRRSVGTPVGFRGGLRSRDRQPRTQGTVEGTGDARQVVLVGRGSRDQAVGDGRPATLGPPPPSTAPRWP